jgi:hypothetical protein
MNKLIEMIKKFFFVSSVNTIKQYNMHDYEFDGGEIHCQLPDDYESIDEDLTINDILNIIQPESGFITFSKNDHFMQCNVYSETSDEKLFHLEYRLHASSIDTPLYQIKEPQNFKTTCLLFKKFSAGDDSFKNLVEWVDSELI